MSTLLICLTPIFALFFCDSKLQRKLSKNYKKLKFLVDLRKKPLSESKLSNELKPVLFLLISLLGHHTLNDIGAYRLFTVGHYLAEKAIQFLIVLLYTKIMMSFLLGSWICAQITRLRLIIQFIEETGHIVCELIDLQYATLQQAQIADEKSIAPQKEPPIIIEEEEIYNLTLPTNINKEEAILVNNAFIGTLPESIHMDTISTTTATTTTTAAVTTQLETKSI